MKRVWCLLLSLLFSFGLLTADDSQTAPVIYWYSPTDGGTPRNTERIIRMTSTEYLIYAVPLMSPLTHAISRVNLICRNKSAIPETLTVHFEVSGDSTRTNFDDNIYGGMPTSSMPKKILNLAMRICLSSERIAR